MTLTVTRTLPLFRALKYVMCDHVVSRALLSFFSIGFLSFLSFFFAISRFPF